MRNNTKNRFISGLLASVMMLNQVPVFAAAEETGLCEHHTIHENCGYVEGISGIPCAHEHTECYALTEECVHDHVDCGYSEIPEENLCDHQCTEDSGCVTKQFLCTHEHDDGCGYREEVAEQPCAYECQQCTDMNVAAAETADYLSAQPVQTEISGTCGENLRWTLDVAGTLTILGTGDIVGNPWHEHKNEIKQVVIESGVTGIGYGAFIDCANITEITIPGTITHIEAEAFSGCSNLKSIALPDSVTTIGNCAFAKCNGLNSVTFPKSVTYIGWNVFNGCASGSITVVFEGSVPSMEGAIQSSVATAYYPIHDSAWRSYVERQLGSVITWIPNNIMRGTCGDNIEWTHDYETGVLNIFGTGAMYDYTYDNTTLTGYSHPWANFANRVNSVIISDGITSLGHNAFYECNNLKTVTIPESITALIGWTFYSCDNLKEIVFEGSAPEMSHAFANVTADVYYASDDPTWTETARKNAGGTLTWIPVSGYCGDSLLWSYDRNTGVLAISGNGDMYDYDYMGYAPYMTAPWGTYLAEIHELQLCNGITSIGNYAFYKCDGLEETTIPDSVTELGESVFAECDNLSSITVGNGVTEISTCAFQWCRNLENVILGNSVTRIGIRAFWNCNNLVNVNIPSSVTVIDREAFTACTSLEKISIPNNVTEIGERAFQECSGLISLEIPSSVTTIGSLAFSGCNNLSSITFLGDAPSIGTSAFNGDIATCYYDGNLSSWNTVIENTYSGTITWVPYGIEEHIHKFGDDNLCECGMYGGTCGENLTWLLDAEGILTIFGTGAMSNYSFSEIPWSGQRDSVKKIVLEHGVASIGDNAFADCGNLNSITLSETITTIGSYAFFGCSNLNNIAIPKSIAAIGTYAFSECSSLSSITIPGSVNTISDYAFADCSSLNSITILEGIASIVHSAAPNGSWCGDQRQLSAANGTLN